MKNPLYILFALLVFAVMGDACKSAPEQKEEIHRFPDTLFVGTLYSPTSYFIYKNDTLGFEYERVKEFAKAKKVNVKFRVAPNMESMLNMLKAGEVDLLAYEIPETSEFKDSILHCGFSNVTYQVLVQPKSDSLLHDVTELVGRDVYVEKNSKYESRLRNLNDEVGGGINIHCYSKDTLITEDLIEMVSDGEIPLTIVDSDIARLNKTYYEDIDISMQVSFPQRSSWAVREENSWLADTINAWVSTGFARTRSKELLKRYFELSKESPEFMYKLKPGDLSPYDSIFKVYSKEIDWDWRLLVAIAKTESSFNPTVVSWAGARGVMQLMPSTAAHYGVSEDEIEEPVANIRAAVMNLKDLINLFKDSAADEDELIRFVLAGYNAGAGHILDAIALAEKHGMESGVWYGNVEDAVMWKSRPGYYNDPVCRYGYFRGSETVNYVTTVEGYYLDYVSSSEESGKDKSKHQSKTKKTEE